MTEEDYQGVPRYRPYLLWTTTLPSADPQRTINTAEVWILPHRDSCGVVGKWNGQACRADTCRTVEEAQQLGWQWVEELDHRSAPRDQKPDPPEPVNWTPPGLDVGELTITDVGVSSQGDKLRK